MRDPRSTRADARSESILEFRPWRERDLDAVCRIERRTFPLPWTRQQFSDLHAHPAGLGWVAARRDGRLVGYAIGWVAADEAELADDGEHRHLRVDHGQRSVQQVRTGERLRGQVAGLHQLQSQLVGVCVSQTATNDDAVFHKHVALDELGYRSLLFERARYEFRNRFIRKRRRVTGELGRKHVKEEHLARESLRGGDGALAPAVREQCLVDEASHRRARLVCDADCVRAGTSRAFENVIDVFAFARLRDADDERVVQSQLCVVDRVN